MAEEKIIMVKQENMSEECFTVQIFGTEECAKCKYKNKGCGGKNIRKTGKNNKGNNVPLR